MEILAYLTYFVWSICAILPLAVFAARKALRKAAAGKFAAGFGIGIAMYAAVAVFAFTLGLFMLTILILSFLAPISSPLFGLLPLLFICIAVFIAVVAYYNMIFRKTGNADDAVSASLGLLELSFTVCFVVESVKLSRFSYDRDLHTYWYAEFLPYSIIITMIAAMIKAGCAFASVLAVRTMYLSEKCSERIAAVASSIIMSVLTVGMDTIIILIL